MAAQQQVEPRRRRRRRGEGVEHKKPAQAPKAPRRTPRRTPRQRRTPKRKPRSNLRGERDDPFWVVFQDDDNEAIQIEEFKTFGSLRAFLVDFVDDWRDWAFGSDSDDEKEENYSKDKYGDGGLTMFLEHASTFQWPEELIEAFYNEIQWRRLWEHVSKPWIGGYEQGPVVCSIFKGFCMMGCSIETKKAFE